MSIVGCSLTYKKRLIVCKYDSSSGSWKSVCLQYGQDIIGYSDSIEESIKNLIQENQNRTTRILPKAGPLVGFVIGKKIVNSRPTEFFVEKKLFYSLLYLTHLIKPSSIIKIFSYEELASRDKKIFRPEKPRKVKTQNIILK